MLPAWPPSSQVRRQPSAVRVIACYPVADPVGQQRHETVARRSEARRIVVCLLVRQPPVPAEIDPRFPAAGQVEVIQFGDAGLGELRLAAEFVDGIETLAVGGPAEGADVEPGIGEHRRRLPVSKSWRKRIGLILLS